MDDFDKEFIKRNYTKFRTNAFKLGLNFQWDLEIALVNQVWLLNQMLFNLEKLIF